MAVFSTQSIRRLWGQINKILVSVQHRHRCEFSYGAENKLIFLFFYLTDEGKLRVLFRILKSGYYYTPQGTIQFTR